MDIVKTYWGTARKKKLVPKDSRLQQEARVGLLFLSPWLLGFIFLKLLPIIARCAVVYRLPHVDARSHAEVREVR